MYVVVHSLIFTSVYFPAVIVQSIAAATAMAATFFLLDNAISSGWNEFNKH